MQHGRFALKQRNFQPYVVGSSAFSGRPIDVLLGNF